MRTMTRFDHRVSSMAPTLAFTADDLLEFRRVLVIAPHPDDEVLGAGGTLARLSDADAEVVVGIVTKGAPPLFAETAAERVRSEAQAAHAHLGVARTVFLNQPAARLDEVPHHRLNQAVAELVREVAPDTLLLPFVGDIHLDHQLTFLSGMVAARPHRVGYPGRILCYETLSETNWNAPAGQPHFRAERVRRHLGAARTQAGSHGSLWLPAARLPA